MPSARADTAKRGCGLLGMANPCNGDMGTWGHGDMGIWGHGDMGQELLGCLGRCQLLGELHVSIIPKQLEAMRASRIHGLISRPAGAGDGSKGAHTHHPGQ